jgi:hypothetical protein
MESHGSCHTAAAQLQHDATGRGSALTAEATEAAARVGHTGVIKHRSKSYAGPSPATPHQGAANSSLMSSGGCGSSGSCGSSRHSSPQHRHKCQAGSSSSGSSNGSSSKWMLASDGLVGSEEEAWGSQWAWQVGAGTAAGAMGAAYLA